MPSAATVTLAAMSAISMLCAGAAFVNTCGSVSCATSNTGSVKCSNTFGTCTAWPSTAGTPRRPVRIEPTASTCSGTIIVRGDSCT